MRKIELPQIEEEFAIGAIAEDGSEYINEGLIKSFSIPNNFILKDTIKYERQKIIDRF